MCKITKNCDKKKLLPLQGQSKYGILNIKHPVFVIFVKVARS